MKKIIISVILACFALNASAQLKSKVDEKFELTSIVFFMAGVPEYWDCSIPSYRADVIKKIAPYEHTEPINFIRELNINHAIGYNAVSTTADMIEIKNGKIQLQSKYDIADIAKYDKRWTPELFSKYIKMLNVFYKQSKFYEFFTDHCTLYELAQKRIDEHLTSTTIHWFKSFYGKELPADINIYINLINGPHNYAINSGVLLGVMSGEDSLPAANLQTTRMLIHELGHHYVNPIIDNNWKELAPVAEKIFPYVKEQMEQNAYSNAKTMMIEWINNLFLLMYSKETKDPFFGKNIAMEMRRGFIGMQRSVDFMENFYANRDKYPTIENFMPQLIAFLNFTADNFDFVRREIEHSKPYITNIYPALNSDISDAKEIIITFSEPMLGSYGYTGWPSGAEPLRIDYEHIRWSDDKYQCIIPLLADQIESGKVYGLTLNDAFRSSKYFSIDEKSVDLIFNTNAK